MVKVPSPYAGSWTAEPTRKGTREVTRRVVSHQRQPLRVNSPNFIRASWKDLFRIDPKPAIAGEKAVGTITCRVAPVAVNACWSDNTPQLLQTMSGRGTSSG